MTADEKVTLARFLDLAGDYLKDGYLRDREPYSFNNDPAVEPNAPGASSNAGGLSSAGASPEAGGSEGRGFSSLPLAYQIDENDAAPAEGGPAPQSLEDISAAVRACKACGLCATRINAVPGEGAVRPLVMIIGEGPGAEEDQSGRPFVGRAGQLLDKMLASIGLFRDKNCYIANMVKCRPPGNRDPEGGEIAACLPFLEQQISLLRPLVILCAGRVAAQNILKTREGINSLRGSFAEYVVEYAAEYDVENAAKAAAKAGNGDGMERTTIPVLCTFHPSALLRDESLKRPAWEDLKLLRAKLESLPAQRDT